MELIVDSLLDAFIDTIKLLPFLFITYLIMEYIEDRMEDKSKKSLHKAGKSGPLWGSLLGVVPQCGFSAAASNLYAGRVITMGTLLAIYLSTSDEMLPILISEATEPVLIGKILIIKIVIGIIVGFVTDILISNVFHKAEDEIDINHFCEHEHCDCCHEHGAHHYHEEGEHPGFMHTVVKPAAVHTVKITAFIFLISVVLNVIVSMLGIDAISNSVINMPVIGEMIAGLIGLIPNCGASVAITTLYLNGAINFGSMISGLLVGAGVGLLILFRVNDNKKQNFIILGILYFSGIVSGILINILGI